MWNAVQGRCSGWPSALVSLLMFSAMCGVLLRYRTCALDNLYKQVIKNPLSLKFLHFPREDKTPRPQPPSPVPKNKPTQGLDPEVVKG